MTQISGTDYEKAALPTKNTMLVDLEEAFFSFDNWYGKDNHLKGNREEMIFQSVDESAKYYSFYEENTSFQRLTEKSNKIHLSRNNTFQFTGNIVGDVKVVIYLIEYGANLERIKTHQLPLNKQTSILKRNQTVYGRLAIRMEGIGDLHIYNMHVSPFIPATFGQDTTGLSNFVKEKKIACILDPRSTEGFFNQAHLINITPQNWENKLLKSKPEFLLVESAWKGNNGTWRGKIAADHSEQDQQLLKELLLWCKTNNVPTVFWNTKDPSHFDAFKKAASMFDYIFTADVNSIPAYKALTGHIYVFYLPLAAVSTMYDKAILLKKLQGASPADDNTELNEVISIVKPSPGDTGEFSQAGMYERLFDALAQGKPVVGDNFPWAKKAFHDMALFTDDENKRKARITDLKKDNALYNDRARQGVREIFRTHLYHHRMHSIVQSINIPYLPVIVDMTLLFIINSKQEFEHALDIATSQSYKNQKSLIILKNVEGYEAIFNQYNNETTAIVLNERLYSQEVVDVISTSFITVMDVNQSYSPYFAEDSVHAGTASSAMVVMVDEDTASPKHSVFNRNFLEGFQMNDIIKKPTNLMKKLQEQNQGVWQKVGIYRLLIPTSNY